MAGWSRPRLPSAPGAAWTAKAGRHPEVDARRAGRLLGGWSRCAPGWVDARRTARVAGWSSAWGRGSLPAVPRSRGRPADLPTAPAGSADVAPASVGPGDGRPVWRRLRRAATCCAAGRTWAAAQAARRGEPPDQPCTRERSVRGGVMRMMMPLHTPRTTGGTAPSVAPRVIRRSRLDACARRASGAACGRRSVVQIIGVDRVST